MMENLEVSERDPLPTIFSLLVKQQRVSEQTNRLIESMVSDVGKAREQSEKLAILANRVENLERACMEFERRRTECIASVLDQFRAAEIKREENKDRIAQLERDLSRQMGSLKSEFAKELQRVDEEMRDRLDDSVNPVETLVSELREKIAFNAGKYGGMAALIVSLVMMLIQWVMTHPPHPKP